MEIFQMKILEGSRLIFYAAHAALPCALKLGFREPYIAALAAAPLRTAPPSPAADRWSLLRALPPLLIRLPKSQLSDL